MRLFAGVRLNEGNTLGNVLLQVSQASLDELGLVGVDLANGVDLLDTVGAELDAASEEVDALVLVERAVDEGGLNDTLLALGGADDGLGHAGTGHGHGEGGRAGTILGLDDLVTTELDAVDKLGVAAQVGVVALAEEGHNGDTRVATDDGDVLVLGVGALDLADEARGTDDIEGGDTEEALGVVDTTGLVDLGADGDGRVDGVGDDEEVGLGGGLGAGLGEVTDDGGVGVEEVVTGHAGLAGNTGGDEDDISALDGAGQAGGGSLVAGDLRLGVDVRDVSGNTGAAADVVQGKLGNSGVELEQEGQRLANATGSTENGDLGQLEMAKQVSIGVGIGNRGDGGGGGCRRSAQLRAGRL